MNGILIGCDRNQEWLLPWWWEHYRAHNSLPVAIADFGGLSERTIQWCRDKMTHLPIDSELFLKEVDPSSQQIWQERCGEGIWPFRRAWFHKPLAFLATPFERTCWLDLDCEVRGSLEGIFQLPPCEIAILPEAEEIQEKDREAHLLLPGEINYNSGVVLFRKKGAILHHWLREVLERNHRYIGDQNALSRAIYLHEPSLVKLPAIYHWKKGLPPNPEAVVIHHFGAWKIDLIQHITGGK